MSAHLQREPSLGSKWGCDYYSTHDMQPPAPWLSDVNTHRFQRDLRFRIRWCTVLSHCPTQRFQFAEVGACNSCGFTVQQLPLARSLTTCLAHRVNRSVFIPRCCLWHLSNPGDSVTPSCVCCWIYCSAGASPNQSKDRRTDTTSSCHCQLNRNDICVTRGGPSPSGGREQKNRKDTRHI